MVESLLCLSIFFGSVIYCCKSLRPKKAEEQEEICSDSYSDISDKIRSLSSRTDNIDMTNDMIADIMSCEPGRVLKTARIIIPESGNQYDFLVNGEDKISDLLIEILETERDIQSTSLRKEINKIQ